jgi:hypothetical protein
MSWRDRDWARLTDDERRRLWGGGSCASSSAAPHAGTGEPGLRTLVWGVVAAAAVGVFALAYTAHARLDSPGPHVTSLVYAGGPTRVGPGGERIACTEEAFSARAGAWVCTAWAILQPGQVALQALDPGGPCGVRHADQSTGRWVCDHVSPPNPDSLPAGGRSPTV